MPTPPLCGNVGSGKPVVEPIVVLRRGKVVADDIDPKHTSIEEVGRVITAIAEDDLGAVAAQER